jgi:hypothetical protein
MDGMSDSLVRAGWILLGGLLFWLALAARWVAWRARLNGAEPKRVRAFTALSVLYFLGAIAVTGQALFAAHPWRSTRRVSVPLVASLALYGSQRQKLERDGLLTPKKQGQGGAA